MHTHIYIYSFLLQNHTKNDTELVTIATVLSALHGPLILTILEHYNGFMLYEMPPPPSGQWQDLCG